MDNIVGLIPAAGYARRVSPLLSCSKEIYPITHSSGESRVVSSYLMESFKKAGIGQAYLILRTGKWDIPVYFKDGSAIGLDLAHIIVEETEGVPQTIDKAFDFIKDKKVLLGFPDILFKPANAYKSLLEKQEATGAELVLGLFKVSKPQKADLVKFDGEGELSDIVIKPQKTSLNYTWIIALWTPVFSTFLHDYLISYKKEFEANKELHIGDVVRDAIQSGLKTTYVKFENGTYLDIGTPEDLDKVNDPEWIRAFESDATFQQSL